MIIAATINQFSDLMPTFAQGAKQLNQALLPVAALLCLIGLVVRSLQRGGDYECLFAVLRCSILVVVIFNMTLIGNTIIGIVNTVTEAVGFDINTNVMGDLQTAIATKFPNLGDQPGNNNAWQFLFHAEVAVGIALFGTVIYMASVIAAIMMFFMSGIQQILLQIEIAVSPVFLAAFMIPTLVPMATRFATFFVALCCWGLGFRMADMVTKGILDFAINTSNNQAVGAANMSGGLIFWWAALALWVIFAYWMSAKYIAKAIVSDGHHGSGFGMLGPGLMASMIAAAGRAGAPTTGMGAVQAAGAIAGGSGGGGAAMRRPYRNYATRT